MERARTDEAELEYEVSGRGEPVVFIHGAFIANTFRPLLAEPSLGATTASSSTTAAAMREAAAPPGR